MARDERTSLNRHAWHAGDAVRHHGQAHRGMVVGFETVKS